MRMALGFLLLFGGAMLGYAVLSGKFPNANAPAPSPSVASQPVATPAKETIRKLTQLNGAGSGGQSPIGLPTLIAHVGDSYASHGGYQ